MSKAIKLRVEIPKIGQCDRQYIDQNGNKVAALLRNANERGYVVLFYLDIPNYEPIEVNSIMRGSAVIKQTLLDNGYILTNKNLP